VAELEKQHLEEERKRSKTAGIQRKRSRVLWKRDRYASKGSEMREAEGRSNRGLGEWRNHP